MKNNYLISFYQRQLRHTAKKIYGFAALAWLVFSGLSASATTYNVTSLVDGHATNQLRGAFEAANASVGPHTINIASGTYTLSLGQLHIGDISGQNVTVIGAGAGSTIINANNLSRILILDLAGDKTDVKFSMSGVQFKNGNNIEDGYGGGAFNGYGIRDVITFTNCDFSNNLVSALNIGHGTISIVNCTFTNNTNGAGSGGAISYFLGNNQSGDLNITGCTFTNNIVTAVGTNGGAINAVAQGYEGNVYTFTANILENKFINNHANASSSHGGAINVYNLFANGHVNIKYNRFVGNTAIDNAARSAVSIQNTGTIFGAVDASQNWWGCNGGPTGCPDKIAKVNVTGGSYTLTPYIQLKASASPGSICTGSTSTITAGFTSNSSGQTISASDLSAFDGLPITFVSTHGSSSPSPAAVQSNGNATTNYTPSSTGNATVDAVVDNVPADETTPARVSITVNSGISISSQPQPVVTCTGLNTSFSVTAGPGSLTYQWRKGTTNLSNGATGNGSTISGATSATLNILNLAAADAGNYNVVVSGGSCSQSITSDDAGLSINTAPVISGGGQPTSVTPCPGSTITFTVTPSSGTTPFTYQWYKGTTALNNGATGNGSTISGATTASLSINNVSGSDNATNYNVKVMNVCNASGVQSDNVALTRKTLPTPAAPGSASVCQGEDAVFNASATGTPPFTFQWRRATAILVDGPTGTGSIISGATTATLTISNVSAADAATSYNYVVNNGCSTSGFSVSGTLTVKVPPSVSISNQPDDFTACAGSPATFSVVPSGTGPFTYQWRRGTTNLVNGATGNGSTISGATIATLTIASPAVADVAGDYNVVITNSCDNTTSANAALILNTAPSIGTQPVDFSGCSGYAASFSVGATSNLSITYQWFKGATPLTNGNTGSGSVISGATTATLLIQNPSVADNAGNYHVKVTNSCTDVISDDVSLSVTSSLPIASANGSLSVTLGNNIIYGTGCGLITTITPSGASPVSGNVESRVWVESSVPSFANAFYLARHYEITPDNEGSATLKLYFLQSEFDAYNLEPDHGPDLPINALDLANNKNNIKIAKKSGISSDGSGHFDTYSGEFTTVTPGSVVWDATLGYWIVTFDVTDFSGFFLTTNPVALPVSLISFNAKAKENHTVDIAWSTASETNNKSFLVERSKDLKTFEKAGEINDVASSSNTVQNYHLTDSTPFSGTSYYRLTQTDLDGKTTVYRAVTVILRSEAYGVFPNPVVRDGQFTLRLDEPETAIISFYSVNGRSVILQKMGVQSGNLLLKSTEKLASGIYLLTVTERGQTRTHRLVVE